jgi:ligand-binding sensor protein
MEKAFSEAANLFLKEFLETIEEVNKRTKFQIFLLNKKGEFINELKGSQPVCKIILSTSLGKLRCQDGFRMGFAIIKEQKQPLFLECYAGFPICWLPIIRNGSFVGAMIICGGRYDRGETYQELKEKFSRLAEELGIPDKEKFLIKVEESTIFDEEEFKRFVKKLKSLIEIMSETVHTPLKEIFG